MINYNTGIDIIEINRIREAVARWGDKFLRRVFTDKEIEICRNRYESLAGRFAAKEACMKALGAPGKGINWRDIEIASEKDGKPLVVLHGAAKTLAEKEGTVSPSVTISHCKDYAVALVIDIKEV